MQFDPVILILALWCHVCGDYVLQSDYMATHKAQSFKVAAIHAAFYTLPFLVLTTHPIALWLIFSTHAVIDHYRLARYVVYAKNFLAPKTVRVNFLEAEPSRRYPPWSECSLTGMTKEKPAFLAVWLLIITDNWMHITINAVVLTAFP